MAIDKRAAEAAAKLFEEFTGHPVTITGSVDIPVESALMVIGECEAIAYNATRDGETHSYQHEFRKSSRPVLAVSHDGLRLYLLAGAYKFTDHGIEDR